MLAVLIMLYDAHHHLQDRRLDAHREAMLTLLPSLGIAEAVVNGTSEADWEAVAGLARQHSWLRPSFGLHPWRVKERSADWLNVLRHYLEQFPQAAVGEIGLDRWIEEPEIAAQEECFRLQMDLAAAWQRPVTIHCLRAWGLLEEHLCHGAVSSRGFLLHSYSGPVEMIPSLVKRGAYFSLSPYFGQARKAAALAVFAKVPLDRLLAETDAPDMRPPDELNEHPLVHEGQPLNHPANLRISYELLAHQRGMSMVALESVLESNYRRLFVGD